MAKVKIQGHASGTGILTVTAPNTSTDRTITLPDATATIATTTDVAARLPSITDGGNATAITIDSRENVGIGVVPETDWWSSTVAMQLSTRAAWYQDSGGTVTLSNNLKDDGTGSYLVTDEAASYILGANGTHKFRVAASGSADAAISFTDALEITNDGRGLSQFTAKAWCNMNQSGTQAIQDSHNISSITDDGVGLTRFTFTNNMANVNYAGSLCSNWNVAQGLENSSVSYVDSAIGGLSGGYVDKNDVTLIIFGD
jgi:hypothetical protein